MNTASLLAVAGLLALHPFHHLLYTKVSFYREAFAALFAIFALNYVRRGWRRRRLATMEILALGLWAFLLVMAYYTDPGVNLYAVDYTGATRQLSKYSPGAYLLRTALLYVPLALLIVLRGLTGSELRFLLWIIVVAAPLSILSNIALLQIGGGLESLAIAAQIGISYNTYVPYITFPFVCALYLSARSDSRLGRMIAMAFAVGLAMFFVVSPSRQSLLFAILTALAFGGFAGRFRTAVVFSVAALTAAMILESAGTTEYATARYLSAQTLETPRIEILRKGLSFMRTPIDWMVGHGLTSVIVSGPHNGYVRWLQRVGLMGMVVTYLPFFLAFWRLLRRGRLVVPDRYLRWLLGCGVFFTLYHSVFGYPREDAWQAPYVWLGLALFLTVWRDYRWAGPPRQAYPITVAQPVTRFGS